MSDGRGDDYIGKTKQVISGAIPAMRGELSWLDHKGQAGTIDCKILEGIYNLDQIADIIYQAQPSSQKKPYDSMKKRVRSHIAHLQNSWNRNMAPHRLRVIKTSDGGLRFDIQDASISPKRKHPK